MTTETNTPERNGAAPRNAGSRSVVIVTAIVGGLALTGVGASAALAAVQTVQQGSTSRSETSSIDVSRIAGLDLDAGGADVTVVFDDVAEATLETSGSAADGWTMRRDGDELVVKSPRHFFGPDFGFCFFWCGDEPRVRTAVLTLPRDLESRAFEADLSLGSGELTVSGAFAELDLDLGSGRANIEGSARSFSLQMGSGDAVVELSDVAEADFDVSSGWAEVRLTGTAPREVDIELSSGDLGVELPDDVYRVDSRVASGDLRNDLRTSPSARNLVEAEVSSGVLTLSPGR